MAKRIQRRRTKGWRMPEGAVYVGRPTRWGNPFDLSSPDHCWTALHHGFRADPAGRHAASVAMFEAWVRLGRQKTVIECGLVAESKSKTVPIVASPAIQVGEPPSLKEIRDELGGRDLVCWCPLDQPCHADVLLELANGDDDA